VQVMEIKCIAYISVKHIKFNVGKWWLALAFTHHRDGAIWCGMKSSIFVLVNCYRCL